MKVTVSKLKLILFLIVFSLTLSFGLSSCATHERVCYDSYHYINNRHPGYHVKHQRVRHVDPRRSLPPMHNGRLVYGRRYR